MSTAQRIVAVCAVLLGLATAAALLAPEAVPAAGAAGLEQIDHLIVIYLENHSFDNLYGLFPGAEGLANAREAPPRPTCATSPIRRCPSPSTSRDGHFASVGGNAVARALHLKDETDFAAALREGTLPSVPWIKPMGLDSEHPGYADVIRGERHAEELLRQVQASRYWSRAAVIVTDAAAP
jgi:phospholipase C